MLDQLQVVELAFDEVGGKFDPAGIILAEAGVKADFSGEILDLPPPLVHPGHAADEAPDSLGLGVAAIFQVVFLVPEGAVGADLVKISELDRGVLGLEQKFGGPLNWQGVFASEFVVHAHMITVSFS